MTMSKGREAATDTEQKKKTKFSQVTITLGISAAKEDKLSESFVRWQHWHTRTHIAMNGNCCDMPVLLASAKYHGTHAIEREARERQWQDDCDYDYDCALCCVLHIFLNCAPSFPFPRVLMHTAHTTDTYRCARVTQMWLLLFLIRQKECRYGNGNNEHIGAGWKSNSQICWSWMTHRCKIEDAFKEQRSLGDIYRYSVLCACLGKITRNCYLVRLRMVSVKLIRIDSCKCKQDINVGRWFSLWIFCSLFVFHRITHRMGSKAFEWVVNASCRKVPQWLMAYWCGSDTNHFAHG